MKVRKSGWRARPRGKHRTKNVKSRFRPELQHRWRVLPKKGKHKLAHYNKTGLIKLVIHRPQMLAALNGYEGNIRKGGFHISLAFFPQISRQKFTGICREIFDAVAASGAEFPRLGGDEINIRVATPLFWQGRTQLEISTGADELKKVIQALHKRYGDSIATNYELNPHITIALKQEAPMRLPSPVLVKPYALVAMFQNKRLFSWRNQAGNREVVEYDDADPPESPLASNYGFV